MKKFLFAFAAVALLATSALAYDRSESESCRDCHFNPFLAHQGDRQIFIADDWLTSSHANSFRGSGEDQNDNTYCAKCHSPFQGDPSTGHRDPVRVPVPYDEWEAVTCGACHMEHEFRDHYDTPIGYWQLDPAGTPPEDICWDDDDDPATPCIAIDQDFPGFVPLYDATELCLGCHDMEHPTRHYGLGFKGFGQIMWEKGVTCVDCHMPKVPTPTFADPASDLTHGHDFSPGDNLPFSCGVAGSDLGACHPNHTESWARKQIDKGKVHGGKNPGGPWSD